MLIETLDGDIAKVNLIGRMDILGAQEIDLHFSVVVGSRRKVVVDMEQVSFLASMGIRTLILGAKAVKNKGGKMVLLNPTADVEKVLNDTGAEAVVAIHHGLEAALAAVA